MDYAGLPGIPGIWVDYVAGLPVGPAPQPVPPNLNSVKSQAEAVRRRRYAREEISRLLSEEIDLKSAALMENINSLKQPETVVVLAEIQASLFGGAAFQLLKCLTAVKLCRELADESVSAVPVCWIGAAPAGRSAELPVSLLDSRGEIRQLGLEGEGGDSPAGDRLPVRRIAELLGKIEGFGSGIFDPEMIEILRSSYGSGETLASATARFIAALMQEWGVVALNPQAAHFKLFADRQLQSCREQDREINTRPWSRDSSFAGPGLFERSVDPCRPAFLGHSFLLPVAASIISPWELAPFLEAFPGFRGPAVPPPVAWPQVSVTVLDGRSSRTLEKYWISFPELFAGGREILERIKLIMPCRAAEKLDALALEVGCKMAELGEILPAGDGISAAKESCAEKIVYQIEKLKERCEAAAAKRQEAAGRQIRRVGNLIAPYGRTQETGLSGIYFLLRHTKSVLQLLYEKLDVMKFEHQLITVD